MRSTALIVAFYSPSRPCAVWQMPPAISARPSWNSTRAEAWGTEQEHVWVDTPVAAL